MDFFKAETLGTVAGASLAITLVTQVIKKLVPGISGRWTNLTALVFAIAIAGTNGKWDSAASVLLILLNGLVLLATATGIFALASGRKS